MKATQTIINCAAKIEEPYAGALREIAADLEVLLNRAKDVAGRAYSRGAKPTKSTLPRRPCAAA